MIPACSTFLGSISAVEVGGIINYTSAAQDDAGDDGGRAVADGGGCLDPDVVATVGLK